MLPKALGKLGVDMGATAANAHAVGLHAGSYDEQQRTSTVLALSLLASLAGRLGCGGGPVASHGPVSWLFPSLSRPAPRGSTTCGRMTVLYGMAGLARDGHTCVARCCRRAQWQRGRCGRNCTRCCRRWRGIWRYWPPRRRTACRSTRGPWRRRWWLRLPRCFGPHFSAQPPAARGKGR